ncbi:hypothetical protein EJ04DRAFT_605640 [Polyplosphaeria fusca]|uniref:HypA n=1 Tax=Polyplosphaeria fusca TaxID=682080 RepID=A0A9P4QYJ6_9PLEO|nr:hypothetical protein EJ04DRAFT_605640 [Polyplosphaeria fusca]
MATSSKIHLTASQQPAFYVQGISSDSADKASQLLQENHEKHHVYFNDSGFHNHIVHHLLTIFALDASPQELQKGYDINASYQRPPVPLDSSVVEEMQDPELFKKYLGKEKHYRNFIAFFQGEMDKKGWQEVLNERLFKRDEAADDMLGRMFAGFLHPIIHLGFGVEFSQPAIIAEGLAQAAIHDPYLNPFFLASEAAAKTHASSPSTPLAQLLSAIHADTQLTASTSWTDGNKLRDGVLARAPDAMIAHARHFVVPESQLEEKTAEMINATAYFTGAAQHPPKQVKFDFFYMHSVNASIFFSSFLRQDWLAARDKARLLEWKGRVDLAMYASRRSPVLRLDEIRGYKNGRGLESWEELFARVTGLEDDGHASKMMRALANGEKACAPFEGREGFVVEGGMWRVLGNMVVDAVEAGEPHWVRSTGFEEAWEGVPDREGARL